MTPMMARQEGDDVERCAGDPECENGAQQGEDRAEDNGERLEIRAEFKQQYREDEENRGGENNEQIVKRFLLLLIEAAKFDGAGGKRGNLFRQYSTDLVHRASQIAAFEARGDSDHLAEIIAAQFQLAGLFAQVGHLAEEDHRAGG